MLLFIKKKGILCWSFSRGIILTTQAILTSTWLTREQIYPQFKSTAMIHSFHLNASLQGSSWQRNHISTNGNVPRVTILSISGLNGCDSFLSYIASLRRPSRKSELNAVSSKCRWRHLVTFYLSLIITRAVFRLLSDALAASYTIR